MRRTIAAWYPWAIGFSGFLIFIVHLFVGRDELSGLFRVEYLVLFITMVILEQSRMPMRAGMARGFGMIAVIAALIMGGETAAQVMSLGALVNINGSRREPGAIFDTGAHIIAVALSAFTASMFGFPVNGPLEGRNVTGTVIFTITHFLVVSIVRTTHIMLSRSRKGPFDHLYNFGVNSLIGAVSLSLGISIALSLRMLGASTFYFTCLTLAMLAFLIDLGAKVAANREGLFGLYQAASSINEALTLRDVFERAHVFTDSQIKHDFAWLALPTGDEGDGLTVAYSSYEDSVDLERATAHVMSVRSDSDTNHQKGQYVWSSDRKSGAPGYFAWIVITPLHLGKQYLGDFGVASLSTPSEIGSEKLQLLAVLSSHLALAVDNAMKFERATMLAFTDPLTGLYNYRQFQNLFREAIQRAQKTQSQVSLIYVDLDYFREVNNNYGHQVGDEALKKIAKAMQASCRDKDLVCRPGGDEFTVILPGVPKESARVVAGRIKENLASLRLEVGLPEPLVSAIGASVGVSTYPEDGADIDCLVRKADADMYSTKIETGRGS